MARKPAAPVDPADLYELVPKFFLNYVDNDAFGRFVGLSNMRTQTHKLAVSFPSYDDAEDYINRNQLEGVNILKVYT